MPVSSTTAFRWLRTGDEAYAAMLEAIDVAKTSVRLETYIFTASELAERFLDALLRATARGARVQALIDAWGSQDLPEDFFTPLIAAGGEFRQFNPLTLQRLAFRDHRKLLVCDDTVAFIGGFNIMPECQGDGVERGWRDIGLSVSGPLAQELACSFDEMFARADFRHRRFMRLRKLGAKKTIAVEEGKLLLSGPGRGVNPFNRAFQRDLALARRVQIMAAYFLPTWAIRRGLARAARRGGQVQLIFPARSDVPLSQLATRVLYQRMLRAGIEIYEYEPQTLHAKLIIVDDTVYVGSSNLDMRSLHINYELLARLKNAPLAAEAREIFTGALKHCRRIEPKSWKKSRSLWEKWREHWAYFILARVDPYVARRQLRALR
jgi:cardiolipin synthase